MRRSTRGLKAVGFVVGAFLVTAMLLEVGEPTYAARRSPDRLIARTVDPDTGSGPIGSEMGEDNSSDLTAETQSAVSSSAVAPSSTVSPNATETQSAAPPNATATPSAVSPSAVGKTSVLVLGDSQAFTLSDGYVPMGDQIGLDVRNAGILGCGVVRGRPIIDGVAHPDSFEQCDAWERTWRQAMASGDADVTMVFIGAWEILDRIVDGRRYAVGTPEYDAYVESQLTRAFDIATAGGTPLVMLSTPCYRETNAALGGLESDRNDPARRAWFNNLAARVSERYGDAITRVDIGEFLCPNGAFTEQINGVTIRPDGVHFGKDGAGEVWHWLAPQVMQAVGRQT